MNLNLQQESEGGAFARGGTQLMVGGSERKRVFECLLLATVDGVGLARLPRILAKAGCAVTLVASRRLLISRSRYVTRRVEASCDPLELCKKVKSVLDDYGKSFDLTVIGDEAVLHALATFKEKQWARRCLPVPVNDHALPIILSKHKFNAAARTSGIEVPRCEVVESVDVLKTVEEFGFPVVLKRFSGYAGSGVRVVSNAGELQEKLYELGPGVAVEEFISGRLGSTEVLFDRGLPRAWISSYSVKRWPTDLSSSCVREITDHPDVAPILRRIGAMTRFTGFAGIDWIQRPDRHCLVVIEFNPRPTPGFYLGLRAGVDFPVALRGVLSGQVIIQAPRVADSRPIHMYPQGLQSAIDERDPWAAVKALRDVPWDDPIMALAALRRVITHYCPKFLRRTR